MKKIAIVGISILCTSAMILGCRDASSSLNTDEVRSLVPKMKMTTKIPESIVSPDKIESEQLGELSFFDGVPIPETASRIYDYLDLVNAVDAYTKGIHIASMDALRKGILAFGPANETALVFEELMDSKALFLTANTTSVYMTSWLQLKEEPMVIETPPDVLGIIDDHYF